MKVGISFFVSGLNAFEPISKASCFTVNTEEDSKLSVAKRRLVGTAGGVNIGAVRFDEYSNEEGEVDYRPFIDRDKGLTDRSPNSRIEVAKRDLAMLEVCPVKSASHTFKCVRIGGVVTHLTYNKDERLYVAPDGSKFKQADVHTLFFESSVLKAQTELRAAGKELTISEDYFKWMNQHKDDKKIVDASLDLGKQMRHVITDVYNGGLIPSTELILPSMYFCPVSNTPFSYRPGALEAFILKVARSDQSMLDIEFAPHKGVVREITPSDDGTVMGLTIQKVEAISNGPGVPRSHQTKYRVLDKYTNIELPNQSGLLELLVEKVDCEVGSELTIGDIVTRTTRIARVVPYDPSCLNYTALADKLGPNLVKVLQEVVMKQHTPNINGRPAISLDFLNELPSDFDPNTAFYIRNQQVNFVFDGPKSALIGHRDNHVKFDMLRHPWYKTPSQARSAKAYNRTGSTNKPILLGDMIAVGAGSNEVQ